MKERRTGKVASSGSLHDQLSPREGGDDVNLFRADEPHAKHVETPKKAKFDDILYVGAGRRLYSYHLKTGESEPIAEAKGYIIFVTRMDEDLFFVSCGGLYGHNLKTGESKPIADNLTITCATKVDDAMCFGSPHRIYRCYPKFGEMNQISETDALPACVTKMDDVLYFGSYHGGVYAYDLKTREQEQITKVPDSIHCITDFDGKLYFGTSHGLYSYEPKTGMEKQIVRARDSVTCMTKMDGVLYFGSYDGGIYSYDLKIGEPKQIANARDAVRCMTNVDGRLYFGVYDELYSCKPGEMKTGKLERVVRRFDGPIECMTQ